METWEKFLPNATIVVLDYKNIGDFIDMRELEPKLLSGRFTLPIISDALRVALLAERGGVWMDIDTIILKSDAEKYLLPDEKHRTVFFGNPKALAVHIAFINTPPAAMLMKLWLDYIREKLYNLTPTTEIPWYFMGNGFTTPYIRKHPDEVEIFDADTHKPEMKIITEALKKIYPVDPIRGAYFDYYFKIVFVSKTWLRNKFRLMKIKIHRRFGGEIFLCVNDGEDAEIFQPNALVVNGAD